MNAFQAHANHRVRAAVRSMKRLLYNTEQMHVIMALVMTLRKIGYSIETGITHLKNSEIPQKL